MDFQFSAVLKLAQLLPPFVLKTFVMSVLALVLALILACAAALVIYFRFRPLTWLARLYVSFFRSTPLLPQLFFLYYGLPQVISPLKALDGFTAAIIGLALNAGAYMAESMRAALLAVDRGQMEAALSVGMTSGQAMRRIIIPQAARIAIPPLFNNFVDIMKGSSLAFTLGVVEMTAKAQIEASVTYRFFESYLVIILIYWGLISLCQLVQRVIEKKLGHAYREAGRD